jgi:redox-sensitive bicupin YhaK (pirin superfamily)
MTAGRGIVHSERSPASERQGGPKLYGMQTWLALPERVEEMPPAFEHIARAALPLVEAPGVRARVIMGTLWGETAPTACHAPTLYADIALDPGGSLPIDGEADERALYVAWGEASLDGLPLTPMTLYILRPGTAATLRSAAGARVMLCGGAAFEGPRFVWWNFVSSSRERINQAKADWREGRFPAVPGDDKEFIPLPEVPLTVSYP